MDTNLRMVKNSKLILPELSCKVAGLLFKVHNKLGRFAREKTYSNALEEVLKTEDVPFEREKRIDVNLGNYNISKTWADFVVDNKLVLEIKAKRFISRDDYFQTMRYLEFLDLPLALIVNFQQRYLKPKRVINPKTKN